MERDDHVQLAICDEGIGIPASDLSRVTKAFFLPEKMVVKQGNLQEWAYI